ncbi:MAG: hypothetical protein LBN95_05045, partial [Prevotellaceae bacterium]|nr:hypothetical protein [Prevotellaceae bacterium]
TIFACASGFLIGYGIGGMIGARISNGRTNWEIVGACEGIGVALLIPAIILTNAGNKKIGKAVDIYNGKYGYSPTLNFGLTSNGIGFNINF